MTMTTAPDVVPARTEQQHPAPSRAQLARGAAVVSGGPVLLAVGSLVAPVAAVRRWPDRAPSARGRRAAWALTGGCLAWPWVYGFALRPWLRTWGSTGSERRRHWPGDPEAGSFSTNTRAVTIHAPAEEVWRWLVQIGQDRGGFYSYDWLENLAGCRLRSADEIRPELQRLEPGDPLTIFPGVATVFSEVDPPRSMVIEGWGAYVVEPLDDASCRLVARSHIARGPGAVGSVLVMELPHAVMERRMLLGIQRRAERAQDA